MASGVLPVPFIPPMLCSRLESVAHLTNPHYVAEPKLDGQRAQPHVPPGSDGARVQPAGPGAAPVVSQFALAE
jgi:ATP-dependent DNA ligase